MNKLKMIKRIMLIGALSLSAAASLFGGPAADARTNQRLQETGPVYFRVAEKTADPFTPGDGNVFTAVDASGSKLSVEGQEVKVIFKNPFYYGGRSNPSVFCDSSNAYKFVGHNPGNAQIQVKIGNSSPVELSMGTSKPEVVLVNGKQYDVSMSVRGVSGNWMLHGDKDGLSAKAYLVGFDVKKSLTAAEKAEQDRIAEQKRQAAELASKVAAVKAQEKSALDALDAVVNKSKDSAEAQNYLGKIKDSAKEARKLASSPSLAKNAEAQAAAKKAEDAIKQAEGIVGKKVAAEKKAAADKIAADKKAAADKLAAEKKAAADKVAAEKKAAADKLAADKKAAADKIAAEKKAAADKLAADKKAAADKIAAEKKAAADAAAKLAAEKKAAADKLAAEKKAAADKVAAEKKAAADKLAADKKAAADKLAADKKAAADAAAKLAAEKKAAADEAIKLKAVKTQHASVMQVLKSAKGAKKSAAAETFATQAARVADVAKKIASSPSLAKNTEAQDLMNEIQIAVGQIKDIVQDLKSKNL